VAVLLLRVNVLQELDEKVKALADAEKALKLRPDLARRHPHPCRPPGREQSVLDEAVAELGQLQTRSERHADD